MTDEILFVHSQEAPPKIRSAYGSERNDPDAWLRDGLDVTLYFRTDVMQKILADPVLRMFR